MILSIGTLAKKYMELTLSLAASLALVTGKRELSQIMYFSYIFWQRYLDSYLKAHPLMTHEDQWMNEGR